MVRRVSLRARLAVLAAFAGAATASAQTADVAIVTSGISASHVASYSGDVRTKLLGTGLFQSVTIVDASAYANYTPSLAELQQYDAVLVWSNSPFANSAALGDAMADYVDSGGGVLVMVFANTSTQPSQRLEGRWRTGGDYEILRPGSDVVGGTASMGTVLLPSHPIMAGVSAFTGTLRPASQVMSPHAVRIADWTDGRILVAASSQYPGRADLGFMPISNSFHPNGWTSTTDGARLMANALLYTMSGPSCYANCDGSTVAPVLNVADFICFTSSFAAGSTYANCDGSTVQPTLNVADFVCFMSSFAAGCS